MDYNGATRLVLERFQKDLQTITTKRGANRRLLIQSVRDSVEMHCTFLVNTVLTLENELLKCDKHELDKLTKRNKDLENENTEHLVWKERYRKHIAELRGEIQVLQKKLDEQGETESSSKLP